MMSGTMVTKNKGGIASCLRKALKITKKQAERDRSWHLREEKQKNSNALKSFGTYS